MAVGDQTSPSDSSNRTLVESWNGSSWVAQPTPNEGENDDLSSVSCSSPTSCMAAGEYQDGVGVVQTLIESWNGHAWRIVASPNQGDEVNNGLAAVSCTTPDFCIATGGSSGVNTLIESWDGSTWSLDISPSPGSDLNDLSGVSCTSATWCSAVGVYQDNGGPLLTLVESWNGSAWSVSPNAFEAGELSSVSCVSSTDCVAAGIVIGRSTLVEAWNGTEWSVSSTATFEDGDQLNGVSCSSHSLCVAVGDFFYPNEEILQTLIETGSG